MIVPILVGVALAVIAEESIRIGWKRGIANLVRKAFGGTIPCNTRVPLTSVTTAIGKRAYQLLDGSGPDKRRLRQPQGTVNGESVVEEIDGKIYIFQAETHPPDSGIDDYHPGVTVWGCK